jgi:mono/diheme cytochrome c family protein
MRNTRFFPCAARRWVIALLLAPWLVLAADVFEFIPAGGRTLLAGVFASGASADEMKSLVSAKRTREEWVKYLQARSQGLPGLKKLDEQQTLTLADYLSFNMPLPAGKVPASPARADWGKILPPDGRDLVLNYCQSCHIITVVVTQDRPKSAWLGTMHKPSHIEIKLTEAQREALASYLVLNAAIPVDQIPEELRAGGASY